MKYYSVIDTNVLVSAMLRWDSVPGKIMEHAFIGDIFPLLNERIIEEYINVLERPKFGFDKKEIHVLIESLIKRGVFVDPDVIIEKLPDPKDEIFYEIVMEKRKYQEAYLITGNKKHFPNEGFVVTPREMFSIMEMNN